MKKSVAFISAILTAYSLLVACRAPAQEAESEVSYESMSVYEAEDSSSSAQTESQAESIEHITPTEEPKSSSENSLSASATATSNNEDETKAEDVNAYYFSEDYDMWEEETNDGIPIGGVADVSPDVFTVPPMEEYYPQETPSYDNAFSENDVQDVPTISAQEAISLRDVIINKTTVSVPVVSEDLLSSDTEETEEYFSQQTRYFSITTREVLDYDAAYPSKKAESIIAAYEAQEAKAYMIEEEPNQFRISSIKGHDGAGTIVFFQDINGHWFETEIVLSEKIYAEESKYREQLIKEIYSMLGHTYSIS